MYVAGGCRFMETSLDEIYNVCMFVAKYVCSEGFFFFSGDHILRIVCMYECMYVCMPRWLLVCL